MPYSVQLQFSVAAGVAAMAPVHSHELPEIFPIEVMADKFRPSVLNSCWHFSSLRNEKLAAQLGRCQSEAFQ